MEKKKQPMSLKERLDKSIETDFILDAAISDVIEYLELKVEEEKRGKELREELQELDGWEDVWMSVDGTGRL